MVDIGSFFNGATKRVTDTVKYAGADISLGSRQILNGTAVDRGVGNLAMGVGTLSYAPYTLGASAAGLPLEGNSQVTAEASQAEADAAALALEDAKKAGNAAEADRQQKIVDRLNAEIKLRQKQPGRSQTLLTSNLTPSAGNTNTLLTNAVNSMGAR